MDVFQTFANTSYDFLTIVRGTVAGDTITSTTQAYGVFKLRTGMNSGENAETRQSDATLHIRPTEPFIAANSGNLVGHGIRVEGKDYVIVGQTAGDNFDTGVREHIRVTLNAEDFSDYE